jgi:uncharacterized repeat protein (TIGR01451 family)
MKLLWKNKIFRYGCKAIWTLIIALVLVSCGGSGSSNTDSETDGGTSNGSTDSGATDTGDSDSGGSDSSGSDSGGSDSAGADEGDTDTGSTTSSAGDTGGGGDQFTFPNGELNVAPVINQFDASPSPLMVNDPLEFSWDVSDANTDDELTCSLDVDSDGVSEFVVEDCAGTDSISFIYKKPGDFTAKFVVTDIFNQTVTLEKTVVVHPLMMSITHNGPVQPGERLQYEVTLSNVSLIPANNISLLHRVPNGIEMNYADDSIPDATRNCSVCREGNEVIWRIGSLEAGESRSYAINADVLPDIAPDTSIPVSFILSSDALIETINREFSTVVKNRPTSEYSMTTYAGPELAGSDMAVHFDIGNISSANLSPREIRVILPPGVDVSSTELTDGRFLDEATGELVLPVPQIALQDSRKLSVMIKLPDDAIPGLMLPLRSRLVDPAGNDDVYIAERSVSISQEQVPLALRIIANEDPVVIDSRLRYEVSVSNIGLVPLNNVALAYRVPKYVSLSYVDDILPSATRNCSNCIDGSEVIWNLDTIEAGASVTISINAEISADVPAGSLLRGEFFAFADNVNGPVSSGITVGVSRAPESELAVSVSQDPIQAGQSFDVEIVAGNVTSNTLSSSVLSLTVPDGLIIDSASDAGVVDSELQTITWQANSLDVLNSVKRTAALTASTDAKPAAIFEFESQFSYNGIGDRGVSANHMATVSELASPITLSIQPTTDSVSPGGNLGLNVTLSNTSLVPANNVVLVYRLPANITLNYRDDVEPDATRNCSNCVEGSEVIWRLGTIAAGANQQIQINANVSADVRRGSLLVSPFTVFSDQIIDTVRLHNIVPVR